MMAESNELFPEAIFPTINTSWPFFIERLMPFKVKIDSSCLYSVLRSSLALISSSCFYLSPSFFRWIFHTSWVISSILSSKSYVLIPHVKFLLSIRMTTCSFAAFTAPGDISFPDLLSSTELASSR